jgi:hypothetical protein
MKGNNKKYAIMVIILAILFAVIYDIFSSNYSASAARDLELELESYVGCSMDSESLVYSTIIEDLDIKIMEKADYVIEYIGHEKYSVFKNDRIYKYSCRAILTRYAVIDESVHIDLMEKVILYFGYDDNDLGSNTRASINPATKEIEYSETEEYYNDFQKIASDAYDLYVANGQIN